MKKTFLLLTLTVIFTSVFAQEQNDTTQKPKQDDIYHDWFNKSPIDDNIYGAEVNKAYEKLLKDKKSSTVVVAVIDGGMDISHEDLKDNIWTNEDEIPANGIDDDQNGYVDDMHGWNYLGNSDGENIACENLEITRIYKRYHDQFKNGKSSDMSDSEKKNYALYKDAKKRYEKALKNAKKQQKRFQKFKNKYRSTRQNITNALGSDQITIQDLDSLKAHNKKLKKDIKFQYNFVKYGFREEMFDEAESYFSQSIDYHLNTNYNPRDIIGDDPTDLSESYGNNNVYGPEADHGTFVAGVIAANRKNNIGINGIVDDVKIIALKAVPNGDERDKDVAKAIRYAVDNGARIINMSFGKDMSPYKYLVDEAIEYAQENGVLLVHAAGNDANNIDKIKQYPTPNISENYKIDNYISVGASSKNYGKRLAASFTNYGDDMVDIFAPGVRIKSLAPEDEYSVADGTSFSSPVVSGVAALILSYYPELTYQEVKDIILHSALLYHDHKVKKPGKLIWKTKFGNLSATGGIISAYEALKLAEEKSK